MTTSIKTAIFLFLICFCSAAFAQDETEGETPQPAAVQKGFQLGLYVGSYFANNYTSSLHDGYGVDLDGYRNNFENSYMYNKIVLEYGGAYSGQPDLIAQELNVMHTDWSFQESDMPTYMRYQPAFLIGLQGRYSVDNKNVILLNINASKLTANGSFTITTIPQYVPGQNSRTIHTFQIKGMEQRLLFQIGYQHLFGQSNKINFLLEGGINITMAKLDKNQIQINNLTIDLTSPYYIPGYPAYSPVRRVGTGLGAFGGLGLNLNANEAFIIQLVYNPTYEGINLGQNKKLKLQNAVGLRAYYKL